MFPSAGAKFFLTADAEVRARRRHAEIACNGDSCEDFAATFKALNERDDRDTNRPVAPLRPAEDAVILDCSDKTVQEVVEIMAAAVALRERRRRG